MGPSRKRARTKPPQVDDSASSKASGTQSVTQPSTSVADSSTKRPNAKDDEAPASKNPVNDLKAGGDSTRNLKVRSSWYGTWPRKSTASTQVARETILADKPTNGQSSTDFSRFEPKKSPMDGRPPSMLLGKSKETSDITIGGTLEEDNLTDDKTKPNDSSSTGGESKTQSTKGSEGSSAKTQQTEPAEEIPTSAQSQKESDTIERPITASGWLGGWLNRPKTAEYQVSGHAASAVESSGHAPANDQSAPQPTIEPDVASSPSNDDSKSTLAPPVSTSWFGLWSTAAPSAAEEPKAQIPIKIAGNELDTVMEDAPVTKPSVKPATGSSWAFWTTDTTKKTVDPAKEPKDAGQLAVSGEASQNEPEPAKIEIIEDSKKAKSTKRGRPQSTEVVEVAKKPIQLDPAASKGNPNQSPAPAKTGPPNLLMPSVRGTYRLVENPSILQQIARLILHGQQQPSNHVFLAKEPPKIKKALAIGIHGLFPAPLLRTVIGQPTGTSIRFANHAAAAIRRWGDQHGCVDCEIEKVALEGEGKIAERVDNLWKLLLNWIEHIRKADFILVACHSQGVPVALMLVAKLIEFGVISTGRIGVCAMAGVSLGPFADYKSRLFSGSAGELFEFADPESVVSKRYEDALRIAMKYGVRVTYCGSIDDQLVSMESSIFSTAAHPYIYRAVFVDGRIHAPNFLSHLIGFALKLRNLGVSDHGLIRELSAPLAGSLYTGEGHSRLYDDEKVYDLATQYALETTSVGDVPLQIQKYEIPTNANPYVLPWIMRGLLEEDFVKTELDTEVTELLKQFDEWKPATKVLKDVKYRLEAVRSKL